MAPYVLLLCIGMKVTYNCLKRTSYKYLENVTNSYFKCYRCWVKINGKI